MARDDVEPTLSKPTSTTWASSRAVVWPLIVLLFFAMIAPMLSRFDFYFGSEAVNVATALEMNRRHDWLLPTLQNEPRLAKPPLTAWITAAAIRAETMRRLSDRDPVIRSRAYADLAWEARWPGLLGACGMLVAAYEIGRAVGGAWVGIVSPLVAGSTLLFLRHSRLMQTDLQLAVWVAVANAFIAHAVLRRVTWTNAIGMGAALGLALLAKGPIALLMTVVPASLFLWWRTSARSVEPAERVRFDVRWIVALIVMLIVGCWWYAWIACTNPSAMKTFLAEATRYGANELEPDKWSKYLSSFPKLFLPWIVFLVVGLVIAFQNIMRRSRDAIVLPLFLLLIPFVVMCCFKERKERYLVPLLIPAAVLAAAGVVAFCRTARWKPADVLVSSIHWIMLIVFVAVLVLNRKYEHHVVLDAIVIGVTAIGVGLHLRYRAALVVTTVILMLGSNLFIAVVFSPADDERSIMKPLADAAFVAHPDAILHGYASADTQAAYLLVPGAETAIYLNRSVQWTTDPARIVPTDRDQLLLVVTPDDVPVPAPVAPWQLVVESRRRDVLRQIFLMPAVQ